MQPSYWFLLAQTIDANDPTHQVMTWTGFIFGVATALVIMAVGLYTAYLKFLKPLLGDLKPLLMDLNQSTKVIAAAPTAPDAQSLVAATRDGVREAFVPLADSVKELITENKELREQADDRAAMNAGLVDRISRLEQQSQRDQIKMDSQQSQIATLQTQVATLETANHSKDTDLAILRSQVEARDASLREKESALAAALQTVKELQALVAEQAEKLKMLLPLEGQYQLLTAEVAALKAQLAMIDKLEVELKNTQDALAAMTADRDMQKARADKLADQLAQADQALLDLRAALDTEKQLHALHETTDNAASAARAENHEGAA